MARRRTLRRACKALRSRTASSLRRARASSSAICSSLRTLERKDLKGIAGPVQSLGGAATSFGRKPLRGFARERPDRACRAGRRTRTAAAALVEGEDRRRPSGAAFRRAGHRQVSTDCRAAGTPRYRAAHALALFLLAAAHRQRALPDHQPDGAGCWFRARRHRSSEARQARCPAGAELHRHVRTPRCLPKCCRCRTMDVIRRSNLTPQQRRQRTLEALTAQLEALSRANPVLMIFEDVHWIDPTSLKCLVARWTG